ncbi:amphi-Trp domain-containing protein [Halopiger goleimassiliensis]|uniref:amphi-Trp domain-containing protein n=1 Tax=Halopiger goleimassiliensis TaxID=1293048 RepID=UPI00067825CC|nr:amphi-Trp domain-containing protein [Halopiger goleimassiliensis]
MADAPTDFELEWTADRAAAATLCRRLAGALEREEPLHVHGADGSATIRVPARVTAGLEIEHDPDADPPVSELELELEWDDADGSSVTVDATAGDAESADADDSTADADDTADGATEPVADEDVTVIAPHDGLQDEERPSEAVAAAAPPEAVARGRDEDEGGGGATGDDAADGDRAERTSRFEVYEDRAGEWRWRLVHWNGNIVADSGEGYTSKRNAKRAARGVMRAAPTARVEERSDGN